MRDVKDKLRDCGLDPACDLTDDEIEVCESMDAKTGAMDFDAWSKVYADELRDVLADVPGSDAIFAELMAERAKAIDEQDKLIAMIVEDERP